MARCWESANDNMLKILFFGSIVSIVIGLYNNSNQSNGSNNSGIYGAIEGIAILVTFFVVTFWDAYNAKSCEQKIQIRKKLLDEKNRLITVFRDGQPKKIHCKELVVGDVFEFKEGMMIPCDSIIIEIDSSSIHIPQVECNESEVTGVRTMQIKRKLPLSKEEAEHLADTNLSNVLYAQSYIIKGKGKSIVCAVGHRTQFGMPV